MTATAKLEDIQAALVARLQSIRTSNGYMSNAGADVKSGWIVYHLEGFQGTDMLAVQLGDDTPAASNTGRYTFAQQFVIAYAVRATPTCLSALMRARKDLHNALLAPGMHSDISLVELLPSTFDLDTAIGYAFFVQFIDIHYSDDT